MKATTFEGGVRGLAFVSGAGISQSMRGSVSHGLLHVRCGESMRCYSLNSNAHLSRAIALVVKTYGARNMNIVYAAVTGCPR
eukprot:COSAG05_NODE_224_length_13609_cov_26.220429_4_plen_82_part_00